MDARLLQQYLHLEMATMGEPEIGPDDVLVRVRNCGSDVHGLDGPNGRWTSSTSPFRRALELVR